MLLKHDKTYVGYACIPIPVIWMAILVIPTKLFLRCCFTAEVLPTLYKVFVSDETTEAKYVERFGATPYKLTDFEKDYKYYNLITHEAARVEYLKAMGEGTGLPYL